MFCRCKITLLLGDHSQLVIGLSRTVLVALFFNNRQRFLIPLFRCGKITLLLGDYPQLVIGYCLALWIVLLLPMFGKVYKELCRTGIVAAVLEIGGQALSQSGNIFAHIKLLCQVPSMMKITLMQGERNALFVQLFWCKVLGKSTHEINKGTLEYFCCRMLPL